MAPIHSPRISASVVECEQVFADHPALVVECTRRGNGGQDVTSAVAPNGFSRAEVREESCAHHIMDKRLLAECKNPGCVLVPGVLKISARLCIYKILHGCLRNAFCREIIARVATHQPQPHES